MILLRQLDRKVEEPKEGEATIKVHATGLCGSDCGYFPAWPLPETAKQGHRQCITSRLEVLFKINFAESD